MAIFKDYNSGPVEHDRTIEDRRRHKELVEKSIKENLADILSEESIIGESKNKKVKIPIRGLKEYQFIYGKNSPGVGSGEGSEKRGDKIGSDSKQDKGKGNGGAGNEEGDDIYETEISIEDVLSYLIEDLELPDMDKKKMSEIITNNSPKRSGYKRHGINPHLAKKRTVIEKLKRLQGRKRAIKESGLIGKIERFPFKQDDLRYHRVKKTFKRESNAAIICVMDVSGSMDSTKKYMARSFFFVLSKFIRMKYNNVEVVFISHTTTAKEVNENEFFHKGESGGTYISSGLNKALEIIEKRYSPTLWNLYTFYVSDGDNWLEDNDRAIKAAKEMCRVCNLFGYAEIMPDYYTSTTIKGKLINEIKNSNFNAVSIKVKQDLWAALKLLLKKEMKEG
jgi:uncharacterized protein